MFMTILLVHIWYLLLFPLKDGVKLIVLGIMKIAGQEACVLGVRERGLSAFEAVLLREVIRVGQ